MQSCFSNIAITGPCFSTAHTVCNQQSLAAATRVQQCRHICGLHSSSSSSIHSRQQLCRVVCRADATDSGAYGEDFLQSQQQSDLTDMQQQQRQDPQQTVQRRQQRKQQQQQQQQQQPGSYRTQQQQWPYPQAASLVGATWGMAERRAHLAALVRAADSVDGLAAVWLRCCGAAGPAELTVLFNRLAAVCEPRNMSVKGWNNAKALLHELLIACEDKMTLMAGPEFVYIIAALAKLRAAPDQAWLNRWLAVSRHKLNLLSAPQLVMCARALCRLDMQPSDVKACIAFPAWMHNYVAALSTRLAACSGFDLTKLLRALADLGYKPARPFLAEFAAIMEPKLPSLDSINLSALMGAFSALKYEPEASFMRAFYAEVYQKLPLFDDQDLATALCAFSSMRRLMKGDFLADFLAEIAEKLPTFGTPALASVLGALGRLGYKPGETWTEKVAAHFEHESRLWKANIHVLAVSAWGLAQCGHIPNASFVEELLAASMPKLGAMEAVDAVLLVQALAKFGYSPEKGTPVKGQRLWTRWWNLYCQAVEKRTLHPRQVVDVLEAIHTCGVTADAATIDYLVLQLVQGGLHHAPVPGTAHLLNILVESGQVPGPLFMKNYAYCISMVCNSFTAPQLAVAIKSLAAQSHQPNDWWLVKMLAISHARVLEFDGPAAANMLWAVAKLTKMSQLPSEKWLDDFCAMFWAGISTVTAQQLGEGLWGATAVGFTPTVEQWEAWEAAAAQKEWQLPLLQARSAVEAFRKCQRAVPEPLLQQLQKKYELQKASREAEVAAAEAARQRAAAALVAQQQRASAAAAAIVAHRAMLEHSLQQTARTGDAATTPGNSSSSRPVRGNSKNRRKEMIKAAAVAAKKGQLMSGSGGVLVLPHLGAGSDRSSGSSPTVAAVVAG